MTERPPGTEQRFGPFGSASQRLAYVARDVALAPADQKLSVFLDRAKTVGELVRDGFLNPAETEDKFWDVARAHRLTGEPGSPEEIAIAAVIERATSLLLEPDDFPPPPSGPEDYYGEASLQPSLEIHHQKFAPVALDDVTIHADPAWLISRLIPARGLACIVGPPKSGKSFFTSDMLCSVARGVPYAGRETLQGPIIYLTGEGVTGFKRRLVAMRRHLQIEGTGVPFYMIENVPDLGSDETDLEILLRDLEQFIADRQMQAPRAIVLDTLARCMGSGDENAAKDMGRFVDRCGAIERRFACTVVVVHHMGKNADRGGRGSNALNGAADVTMLVEKFAGYSKVRIDEMKDGPEGQEWRFRLLPFDLSATSDNLGATSENGTCVVELLSEPGEAQPSATKKPKPPVGVAGDLLKVIRRAIEDMGETNVGSFAVPNSVRTVSRANLKNYCTTMAWQADAEANTFRAMLSKTLSQLRAKDLINFDSEWVWLT